jgi:hypothetical protein
MGVVVLGAAAAPRPLEIQAVTIGTELLIKFIIALSDKLMPYLNDKKKADELAEMIGNAAHKGVAIDWRKIDPSLIIAVVKAFANPICQ